MDKDVSYFLDDKSLDNLLSGVDLDAEIEAIAAQIRPEELVPPSDEEIDIQPLTNLTHSLVFIPTPGLDSLPEQWLGPMFEPIHGPQQPGNDPQSEFHDPMEPVDSDIEEDLVATRDEVQDDDVIEDINNPEGDIQVSEDEVQAWMSPKRAKQKELMLLSQYRRCGKFEKRINNHWVIRERQADKIKRQHLAIKQLKHLLRLNRKSCNDIVEMTINNNKN